MKTIAALTLGWFFYVGAGCGVQQMGPYETLTDCAAARLVPVAEGRVVGECTGA